MKLSKPIPPCVERTNELINEPRLFNQDVTLMSVWQSELNNHIGPGLFASSFRNSVLYLNGLFLSNIKEKRDKYCSNVRTLLSQHCKYAVDSWLEDVTQPSH